MQQAATNIIVNIQEAFAKLSSGFESKQVTQFDDVIVGMISVEKDSPYWERHDENDEFFLIIEGKIRVNLGDKSTNRIDSSVVLSKNDIFIIPKGVDHKSEVLALAKILFMGAYLRKTDSTFEQYKDISHIAPH